MLSRGRLLTLTGAGGVGKSRLALRVVETVRGRFADGVRLVELATLADGELLEPTVAASLGLHDAGPRPMALLLDYLADKRMLLVLDNCEHLLEACAALAEGLLRGAPRLRILATSQQTLGVYGEQVLSVPPLSVPDPDRGVRPIARHEAVRLLVERAARVRPGFTVDAGNASSLARLTQRLDGIPLALELAAVRMGTTPEDQLLQDLDERFEALTGGGPAALPRHQTLRATMDWSFGLCSPAEQRMWGRLSIFAGGIDLEAAEAVCSGEGIAAADILDLMAGLVDKSVLFGERRAEAMRYRMLGTIRAYGRERLTPGDERALGRRYWDYYRVLVERNQPDQIVADQLERYRTLQRELPNIRVALDLGLHGPGTAAQALELASSLRGYWILAGSLTEGRHWLERGLELARQPSTARAAGLWVDSLLALLQGDLAAATPRLEECRDLARRLGDESALAYAIETSGIAAWSAGDGRRGLALLEDSLARHRALGDVDAAAINCYYLAAYGSIEDVGRAAAYGEEFLALCETRHARVSRGYGLFALGIAAWHRGDWRRAESLVREAARLRVAFDDRWGLTQCLEVLAWTAGARGRHERAARILGAANALWLVSDASPTRLRHHRQSHEHCEAQARQALGDRAFAAVFRSGARLELGRAVTYAVQDDGEAGATP
ncbi:LuxR family transcriptional regulator [Actinomadura vinacea]|uniref:LuxR family transcriptional regulator n=1 Tax=Actinomadura vinacea TaxID=115336 RepID=A0ABN3JHE7_9ACTN